MELIHGGDFACRHANWLKAKKAKAGNLSHGYCQYLGREIRGKPKNSKRKGNYRTWRLA